MDIDNLPAGHALDELIHSKVMGWKLLTVEEMQAEADRVWKEQPNCRTFLRGFEAKELSFGGFGFRNIVKPYSTDIANAWEVAERLAQGGGTVTVTNDRLLDGWYCVFAGSISGWATEATAELAICRAALKAVAE